MYTPRAFAIDDPEALDALFAHDPFVTLTTIDAEGVPVATHLPVLYRRDGDRLRIEGHWARPNPQVAHAGTALMIVHGPHAYVSPGWYPDKAEAARVPTWNYTGAHLRGRLERFDNEASLADLVARTSECFEARIGGDWAFDVDDDRERRQLRGIIGFRFHVESVVVKHKLNQNHPVANRHAVADALANGGDDARAIAALMRALDP